MTKILFIDNRERSGLEDLVKKYIDKKDGLFHQTKQNMIGSQSDGGTLAMRTTDVPMEQVT